MIKIVDRTFKVDEYELEIFGGIYEASRTPALIAMTTDGELYETLTVYVSGASDRHRDVVILNHDLNLEDKWVKEVLDEVVSEDLGEVRYGFARSRQVSLKAEIVDMIYEFIEDVES